MYLLYPADGGAGTVLHRVQTAVYMFFNCHCQAISNSEKPGSFTILSFSLFKNQVKKKNGITYEKDFLYTN